MITRLKPYVQRKIWGGTRLSSLKGLESGGGKNVEPVGETWEISIHPEGTCLTSDGKPLSLKPHESKLPYLVKFIDTNQELSIQVHPGDEYALKHEKSTGKSECWLIIDANEGAGIFLGLKPGVSKEKFISSIKDKHDINESLNFYEVKAGDFFFVPAGTIHAIGAGITLAEVQQNSGITYRVWDWNRLDSNGKSRELHIDKSLDVINFERSSNELYFFKHARSLFSKPGKSVLIEHESFKLSLINLHQNDIHHITVNDTTRIPSILSVGGTFKLNKLEVKSLEAVLLQDESDIAIEATTNCSLLVIE